MDNDLQREEEIFLEALELAPGPEREAFLATACGGDSTLRRAVEGLLDAHAAPPTLLADIGPVDPGIAPQGVCGLGIPEGPGSRIGPYRIVEQIGEGGFGVVFMAEQRQPLERRVALKIIKPGMDSADVVARFEAERQALAMMDHPNIARVLDAGTTDSGRPFFVMELVDGIALTTFCDERRLDTRKRLELFLDVCSALNHAHQKGIIHRDLKPSNILVTLNAEQAAPKVIDFGIAKATRQQLTEKTLCTRFGQMLGTPAYMSPEQADLSGLDLDTRSDIYALGVLLYELLSGRPPFDPKRLLSAGYDEMRRIIREDDPPRPSTRIATLEADDRTTVADHHRSDPGKLRSLVSGDLDWIVMKAIEKDRTRRYETANGLALDIRRHLNDEPVTAGPPTARYRFAKFVRRNRVAVAFAATVTVLLVAGVVASSVLAVRAIEAEKAATEQAERASEAERLALEEAKVGDALADFFTNEVVVKAFQGGTFTLRDLLAAMSQAIAELERLDDQPLVQAGGYLLLSRLYDGWMRHDQARDFARRSFTVYSGKLGIVHEKTLAAAVVYLNLLLRAWKLAEAQEVLARVVEPAEASHGPAHHSVRELLERQARHAEIQAAVDRARRLPELREFVGEHPDDLQAWTDLSGAHATLSELAWHEGRRDAAVLHFLCAASLAAIHNAPGGIWNECNVAFENLYTRLLGDGLIGDSWKNSDTLLSEYDPEDLLAKLELPAVAREVASAAFHHRGGRTEEALTAWETVVNRVPDCHRFRHAWAMRLDKAGQPDRAVREYRTALQAAGERNDAANMQWYATNWNRLRRELGLPLDALTFVRTAPLVDPESGHCYARLEVALPWHDAEEACRDLKGTLAIVTSPEEDALLTSAFASDRVCWLGASRSGNGEPWRWIDESELRYTSWSHNEPSGLAGADFLAFGAREPLVMSGIPYSWPHHAWCARPAEGTFAVPFRDSRMRTVAVTFPLCEWTSEEAYRSGTAARR